MADHTQKQKAFFTSHPKNMKTYKMFPLLAASLLAPSALIAQNTATTTPVGYETLTLNRGFNFAGARLHHPALASGKLESFQTSPNRVTDNDVNLAALITSGTYVLEIEDGSGIIQEVSTVNGNSLVVAADLSGLTYPLSYKLRKAATLASLFGNQATGHKLDIGSGSNSGADQIWLWNGSGYVKYYFDAFAGVNFDQESWVNSDTGAVVDGAQVNIIYADGMIISSAAGRDVVVSGEVKLGPTELNLARGFNFVSPVSPAGTTLGSSFGSTASAVTTNSNIRIGSGSNAGADQIWVWSGSGFTKYYFDAFAGPNFDQESWVNVDTQQLVDPTTPLPSGFVVSASTPGNAKVQGPPSN